MKVPEAKIGLGLYLGASRGGVDLKPAVALDVLDSPPQLIRKLDYNPLNLHVSAYSQREAKW